MNKRYWCIWFSFAAFIALYFYTDSIVNPNFPFVRIGRKPSKKFLSFTKNIGFSFSVVFGVSNLLIAPVFYNWSNSMPNWSFLIRVLFCIVLYLQGVYCTYRLCTWREKNLLKNDDLSEKYDNKLL